MLPAADEAPSRRPRQAACAAARAPVAQLHGDGARAALGDLLASRSRGEHALDLIFVASVREDGSVATAMPSDAHAAELEYLLVDGVNPGSGEAFDWDAFEVR